ncbi:serine protease inhibitor 42Dd-like [Musca vetustissima]|uniref:serine protease inhibitor 42Dd-like n=1 Tax=Musca vetustissima TaxID=27455 RepID=UPI002AB7570D|nr:serine protease inhibitor 42Dd-like [Musca vetustissima]
MGVNTHFIATICVMTVSVIVATPTTPLANVDDSQSRDLSKSLEDFGTLLYSQIAKRSEQKNILFSPFSIETNLAMLRLGATGQTAAEIDNALHLKFNDGEKLANSFEKILSIYQNSDFLQMANKIYIKDDLELRDEFNKLLAEHFFASAENVNFTQNIKAAETINSWVAAKTNQLIKDLVSADDLSSETRLLLLNAIYFKGEWEHAFPEEGTRPQKFYVDATNSVDVEMMHTYGDYRYGKIDQLDATALEMPYKNSDLYMLVILPNSRDALEDLRIKLQSYSLQDIRDNMALEKVTVKMPKFKTEYTIELKETLKSLGIERMFSKDAELEKMTNSSERLEVTKVLHKAFIEVNENGTKAAASTGMYNKNSCSVVAPETLPFPPVYIYRFVVDHGFIYKIVNSDGIEFFEGSQSEF